MNKLSERIGKPFEWMNKIAKRMGNPFEQMNKTFERIRKLFESMKVWLYRSNVDTENRSVSPTTGNLALFLCKFCDTKITVL